MTATSLSRALARATAAEATHSIPTAAGDRSEQHMPQDEVAAALVAPAGPEDGERQSAGVTAAQTAVVRHLVSGLQTAVSGGNVLMTLLKASLAEGGFNAPRTPRKVSNSNGGRAREEPGL